MGLRLVALALGTVTGFVFGWARLTDPDTFHRMLALRSPTIYLLMAGAVATAFLGSRLVRGRRALLTGEPIAWSTTRPSRDHVLGSAVFGLGWAVSAACPGPTVAQLGSGRVLAVAVAAGIVAGVALQPLLASALDRVRRAPAPSVIQAADVL
jgi:uncharacterized membrane protein YedE/YeeE